MEIRLPRCRQAGKSIDFLLAAKCDMAVAKRFFDKVMPTNGDPEKIAMDKSDALFTSSASTTASD